MPDLAMLQSALRKADAAGDTYAATRFANEIRSLNSVNPQQAMAEHANSMEYKMAVAGAEPPRQPFLRHAAQSLKEMAIPAITTAAGSTLGLPGAIIGAGTGELMNQAMGISGGSVIPEANLDKGRVALAAVSPAILPAVVGTGRAVKGVVKKGVDVLRKAVEPLHESGRNAILQRYRGALMNNDPGIVDDVIVAARNAKQLVPGSNPTIGQAVSHLPTATGIAAYENKIGKMEGISPYYMQRQADQESARAAALSRIAKTPGDLKQALAAREAIAGAMYQKAMPQIAERDAKFAELMQRPSMQAVTKRAADIAKEAGRTFKIGQDLPEQLVTSPIVSASGQPITRTIPAQVSKLPIESLHDMKMAMDDLIKNPERFGIGAKEAAGIANTQRDFVKWIGAKVSDYDLARQLYQVQSIEPNRMQVGQLLKDALESPLESVAGQSVPKGERAAILAKAVQDAPRTIKNATGKTMFDRLDEVLSPAQVTSVDHVVKDLTRSQAATKLAAGTQLAGTDAIPGQVGLHLPPMLSRPAMLANWALGKLGEDTETRIAKTAGVQGLYPQVFADSIQDLPGILRQQQIPSRTKLMIDALLRWQQPLAALAATEYNHDQ